MRLLEKLMKNIDDIYDGYSFLNLPKNIYYDIVLEELKGIDYIEKDYKKEIKKVIKKKLDILVLEKLDCCCLETISNYINKMFVNINIKDKSMLFFKKLDHFFDKYNVMPNTCLINNLFVNCELFLNMTNEFMNKYYDDVNNGKLETLEHIPSLLLIMNTYISFLNKDNHLNELSLDSMNMYLKEIEEYPILSTKEEKKLLIRAKNGDADAKNKIVNSNLRLVTYIAKRYANLGLSTLDLIQEGNIGLMISVENFDLSKNTRFCSYARCVIKSKIIRAIEMKGKYIYVPYRIEDKINLLKNEEYKLYIELQRKPTLEEISKKMNISIEELLGLYMLQYDIVSLDDLINSENNALYEEIVSNREKGIEEHIIEKDLVLIINDLFDRCKLSDKEKNILSLRYGLNNGEIMYYSEIGKIYGVSCIRISQIEERIIKKIRLSNYINDLFVYADNNEQAEKNIKEYIINYKSIKRKKTNNDLFWPYDSIYKCFNNYSKEDIKDMVSNLDANEKELIKLKYGDDLDVPCGSRLDYDTYDLYYAKLLPKMKKIMKKNYKEKNCKDIDFL